MTTSRIRQGSTQSTSDGGSRFEWLAREVHRQFEACQLFGHKRSRAFITLRILHSAWWRLQSIRSAAFTIVHTYNLAKLFDETTESVVVTVAGTGCSHYIR